MSTTQRMRLVNPRLGMFFAIFTSCFVSLFVLVALLEQLGIGDMALRLTAVAGPLVLFAGIGVWALTNDVGEFYAAGRRVPAVYNGLMIALSASGGTLFVAGTGLIVINGFDAWAVPAGIVAGFVAMAVLIAPYLRKFGSYTVASYLGRRFESRLVRLVAAAIAVVPLLIVVVGELRVGSAVAGEVMGSDARLMVAVLAGVIAVGLVLGGVRGAGWVGAAQAIAALIAIVVPAGVIGVMTTNLPIAQLSHGPILRAIGRVETIQSVPVPELPAFAFSLAGSQLTAIAHPMATPFGSLGPASFSLLSLMVMAGVASAPWLVMRAGTTPSVYEARKSLGWAIFFFGVVATSLSTLAVFFRERMMFALAGRDAGALPDWFNDLVQRGLAGVGGSLPALPVTSFSFSRDAVLFALPAAYELTPVLTYLISAGALAAALACASATAMALAAIVAEDVIGGLGSEPPAGRARVLIGRVAIGAVLVSAGWIAAIVPFDPLRLFVIAMGLLAASLFPVLVMSIWWKRLTAIGATAAMVSGFVVTLTMLFASEAVLGLPQLIAGCIGMPVAVVVGAIVSAVTPGPGRHVVERIRDMRIPGGETIYDREMRLKRKSQEPA